MTERDAASDPWSPLRARPGLIAGTSGVDFEIGGLALRVSDSPLFRRAEDGQLRQAIRLWARAMTDLGELTFTALDGDAVLDRVTVAVRPGSQTVHLLVPEVSQPRTLQLDVAGGAGEPFRGTFGVTPQRKWRIFLVHHSHLDIGYTDPQALVLEHQLAYLDAALDLVAATDSWPEPARFRWNVEVNWPLRHWLAARPKTARDAFFDRVREGRIEVHALPFSMHTEAYSIDELARQLWFTDELRERYGLSIVSAMQTDVPGATAGLATLLTEADIRYLAVAHNYAGRSVPYLVGGQELARPFYWAAPNGKRLLVWYTDTAHGIAYMDGNLVGLATDYQTALGVLPEYLNALAQRSYPYGNDLHGWKGLPTELVVTKRPYPHDVLHLRLQSTVADNAGPSIAPAEIVREWNAQWAYPRLRLAANREFFETAEEHLGDSVETYAGDWTDWWADGIGSGARPLGFNRQAQGSIRTAQTMHTLADVLSGDVDPARAVDVDHAYDEMALFDEHTWGAANPWDDSLDKAHSGGLQWGRKAAFAQEAYDRTNALISAGTQRLAHVFGTPQAAAGSIIVFNPSAWDRTDLVRVFIPFSRIDHRQSLTIVDAVSGASIEHAVEAAEHAPFRPRGRFVSFIARDIPALGYARFDLSTDEAASIPAEEAAGATATGSGIVENAHYRLELDPAAGLIARLVDKDAGQELINAASPFGFNQYIYDRYTSAPHFNHLSGRFEATDLSLLGSRSTGRLGVVTEHASTPVWDRLTVRLVAEGSDWLETTLTLLHGVKRLDITNRLSKIATPQKESVYFAFPFNLHQPTIEYEITGAVSGPTAPHVPGSASHMRAIRHWITLDEDTTRIAWATLEAPLIELGTIHLPYAPFPATIDPAAVGPATIYSWALNNLWDTNFPPAQGGEMTFRYAVATGTASEQSTRALGVHTAAGLTTPLIGIFGAAGAGQALSNLPVRGSFCQIDQPEVEIVALSPSRRDHDLVLFLHSHAAEPVEARLAFPLLSVRRAWTGTFLERGYEEARLDDNEVTIPLQPGALAALALDLVGAS